MKVLIAVDESQFSQEALNFVGRCPWPDACEFQVLNVNEVDRGILMELRAEHPVTLKEFEEKVYGDSRELIDSRVEALKEKLPGKTIEGRTELGDPRDAILKTIEEWQPQVLVMGSHGRTGIKKFLLGSVAEQVLLRAGCAVVIVKGERDPENTDFRVLIALEDRSCIDPLAEFVSEFPIKQASHCKVVHIVSPVLVNSLMSFLPAPLTEEIARDRWRKGEEFTSTFVERIRGSWSEATIEPMVVEGDTKLELLDIIEKWKPHVVLLGSHKKRGIASLGSVSSAVVAHSPCTAAVIPIPADRA
ncbi:MAG: universal stress protein [Cyanobacteria bacterium HKST-UBA02]|nr:universal stress protein [Cyanobacteria bacterium HKST-UBA02]